MEMVVETHAPNRGDYKLIGCPIKLDSNHVELKLPPLLGEHSVVILSSILHMEDADIADLQSENVI